MNLPKWLEDCPKCKKAPKTALALVLLLLCAMATGFVTTMIFWIIAYNIGMSEYDMLRGTKLTTLCGTTAFLWWVWFQYDKMICTCDED